MGLDIFDGLAAIGDGVAVLGVERDNRRKEKLAQKLKLEEEARAEQRQIAREKRAEELEGRKVVEKDVILTDSGAYVEVGRNPYGAEVMRRDANPLTVQKINNDLNKDKVTIEQIVANTDAARANAEQNRAETRYMPERYSLQSRLTEAQIRNYDEPNRANREGKVDEDDAVLSQARSMIGKRIKVKDAETGEYVVKIATPAFVAEWLRQKGRRKLADEIYKEEDEE